MSNSRLEKFIYAICSMDVSDLPVPLSRIEKLWNCLITGETPDFEPLSRNEKYLMAMLDRYDISNLPAPMSRGEKLLYKIAVGETDLSDVPGYLSRYEELLKYLIENGGIGFEYVLHTLNQSLSTLYTTAEKPVKSAILKGQTLVNISEPALGNGSIITAYQTIGNSKIKLKSDTKYFCWVKNLAEDTYYYYFNDNAFNASFSFSIGYNQIVTKTMTTKENPGTIWLSSSKKNTSTIPQQLQVMLIEYQEGMENWDIPYFEGMQSVKMPVLTTTGKNLNNQSYIRGNIDVNTGIYKDMLSRVTLKDHIKIEPNTKYSYRLFSETLNFRAIYLYDVNKNYIGVTLPYKISGTFDGGDACYINFCAYTQGDIPITQDEIDNANFMLVKNETIPTTYEPYKSNILTVNEEVELRGIGEGSNRVEDELDCLTGEATQRVGEIVLDGTEEWNVSGHSNWTSCYTRKYILPHLINKGTSLISDKMLSYIHYDHLGLNDVIGIAITKEGYISFKYLPNGSKPQPSEVSDYLKSNPITIQYPLETESIKTVDLTTVDQDGQPTKLKTFNDISYVEINSDNIIPSVDLEVATKISETLSTMGLQQLDISNTQNELGQTIDEQSENTDATMMATTEIYEQTL